MQSSLCFFRMARESPVTVPPVPAPAMIASTLPEEGRLGVDGVATTASMISGPVVYSCAKGLFTCITELNPFVSGLEIEKENHRKRQQGATKQKKNGNIHLHIGQG